MGKQKLELKHLAPYLPYGLKGILIHCLKDDFLESDDWVDDIEIFSKGTIWTYAGYADEDLLIPLGDGDFSGFLIRHGNSYASVGNSVKPILKLLSDLTKKELDNFTLGDTIAIENIIKDKDVQQYQNIEYSAILYLLKNHYDFQLLIEKGLAIDINTLKS